MLLYSKVAMKIPRRYVVWLWRGFGEVFLRRAKQLSQAFVKRYESNFKLIICAQKYFAPYYILLRELFRRNSSHGESPGEATGHFIISDQKACRRWFAMRSWAMIGFNEWCEPFHITGYNCRCGFLLWGIAWLFCSRVSVLLGTSPCSHLPHKYQSLE